MINEENSECEKLRFLWSGKRNAFSVHTASSGRRVQSSDPEFCNKFSRFSSPPSVIPHPSPTPSARYLRRRNESLSCFVFNVYNRNVVAGGRASQTYTDGLRSRSVAGRAREDTMIPGPGLARSRAECLKRFDF